MKKLVSVLLFTAIAFFCVSCDNGLSDEEMENLCSYYWESYADVLQFTADGKLLLNYSAEYESESVYAISDGKITMYIQSAPEDAMTFDFVLEDDRLYIGQLEYKKGQRIQPDAALDEATTENAIKE